MITKLTHDNLEKWGHFCSEVYPDTTSKLMIEEYNNGHFKNEYLYQKNGVPVAFISLSIRKEYVEGKEDFNPCGYLEGIYVSPEYQKQGIAKELIEFAKQWSIEQGCTMLASDCYLDNVDSRNFHNQIGFSEAGVNVHFVMGLK